MLDVPVTRADLHSLTEPGSIGRPAGTHDLLASLQTSTNAVHRVFLRPKHYAAQHVTVSNQATVSGPKVGDK